MRIQELIRTSLIFSLPLRSAVHAGVNCTISDFTIESYDHGGAFIHGKINGTPVSWINICGVTGGQNDCSAKATDRRLALALAAKSAGKSLNAYFASISACSAFQDYMTVNGLRMNN